MPGEGRAIQDARQLTHDLAAHPFQVKLTLGSLPGANADTRAKRTITGQGRQLCSETINVTPRIQASVSAVLN